MKYTKEFKLECIRKHIAGEYIETPADIMVRKHFMNQVRRWERIYQSMGEAGLEHGRPTLDIEQRINLINRVESGEYYQPVALSAGVGTDTLIKWHRTYLESGIDGLKSMKRGRKASMNKKPKQTRKEDTEKTKEELLEELEYLRAENAYLKKLNALVQERKAREQKKK